MLTRYTFEKVFCSFCGTNSIIIPLGRYGSSPPINRPDRGPFKPRQFVIDYCQVLWTGMGLFCEAGPACRAGPGLDG